MMRSQTFIQSVSALIFLMPTQIKAQDIDYEGPQARYEDQQRIADRAQREYDSQSALLRSYQAALNDATARRNSANRIVQNLNDQINNINDQLDRKERQINQNDSENTQYRRQIDDIKDDIRQLENSRTSAQRDVNTYQQRYNDLDNRIKVLERDDPQNSSLPGLRQDRANAESQMNSARNTVRNYDSQIASKKRDVDNLSDRVDQNNWESSNLRTEIRNLDRDRDNLRSDLEDAKDDARRAESEMQTASRDIERQRVVVDRAEDNFIAERDVANRLYREYQEVLANYNREVARVLGIAEAAATGHSNREADERAVPLGISEGTSVGERDALQKAEVDKRARDLSAGYIFGRSNPQSTDEMKSAYAQGVTNGSAVADRKATAEDLPKGYNQSLSQLLGSTPANQAVIDVTNDIPNDPGSNATELSTNPRPIGNVAGPVVTAPTNPTMGAPVFSSVNPNIPASQNTYANPPCAGQRRPDIEVKCRQKYADVYTSQFAARYKVSYVQNYGSNYNTSAKNTYDSSVAQTDDVALQKGKLMGAGDTGLLDGYASRLPAAQTEKFAAGQTEFGQILSQSYSVNFKTVEIEDTNQNGIIEPSDKARIKMTFDNLGLLSTPLGNIKIKIVSTKGVETVVFQTRDTPSLAPNTRTTLVGITSIIPAGIAAGSKLEISGDVYSKNASGDFLPVASFSQSAVVNYPLEVADITLPGSLKVNEKTNVKVVFKNMTNKPIVDAASTLKSVPAFLDITPADFKIQNLAPGASNTSDTVVTAGPWITDGIPVNTMSSTTVDSKVIAPQPFGKAFTILRNAAVKILDANGRPLNTNTIEVKAGRQIRLKVQLDFKADRWLQGPFVIAKTNNSTPLITNANNSTISIDYGSVGPGTTFGPSEFVYDTATSLAGKTEWIMFGVREGNKWLHTPQIFVKFTN